MKYTASILSDAEEDIDNAFIWYEQKKIGLGISFFNSLNDSIDFICNNPFTYSEVIRNVRRFIIRKFPFGLYYIIDIENQEIKIIGVIHFKRSSKILKKRI